MRSFNSRLLRAALGAAFAAALVAAQQTPVAARPKPLDGPIPAFVENVIDGDTLSVRARIWLGQELQVLVRIKGIDTPELKARCDSEKQQAVAAKAFVQKAIGQRRIYLRDIREDKYAGRVVADVTDETGRSLSERLLAANLARPYKRGRRLGWCSADTRQAMPARPAADDETRPQPGLLRTSLDAIRSYVGK